MSNCFYVDICWMVEWLNKRGMWYTLSIFCEKCTSWSYLDGSGLKNIFLPAPSRPLFSFCEVMIGSWPTKTTLDFTLDCRLSD